jgi:hypothetical protein
MHTPIIPDGCLTPRQTGLLTVGRNITSALTCSSQNLFFFPKLLVATTHKGVILSKNTRYCTEEASLCPHSPVLWFIYIRRVKILVQTARNENRSELRLESHRGTGADIGFLYLPRSDALVRARHGASYNPVEPFYQETPINIRCSSFKVVHDSITA